MYFMSSIYLLLRNKENQSCVIHARVLQLVRLFSSFRSFSSFEGNSSKEVPGTKEKENLTVRRETHKIQAEDSISLNKNVLSNC